MPKQPDKTCCNCLKTVRKNQKSLICSQCLQIIHVKCTGKDSQTNNNGIGTWKCNLCNDFSFPFSSCSDVEFDELYKSNQTNSNATLLSAYELNKIFDGSFGGFNEITCTESDDLTDVDEICLFDTNDRYVTSSKAHTNLLNDINNSSDNNFTAISLNIRSLNNYKNLAKLEGLLSSLAFKPSLIAVTETWLKPNQSGPHTNLQDYIFISNPRSKFRGGGVGFYIKNDVVYSRRTDLEIMNEKVFEAIFVDIMFKNKTITCGNIYHSPSKDANAQSLFQSILENTLHKISKRECLLFGDFNINLLDCDEPNVGNFIEVMLENGYRSLINRPTRITQTNGTLLDHIWTNCCNAQKLKSCIITYSISDHLVTMICMSIKKSQTKNIEYYRSFSDTKIASFTQCVSELDITPILEKSDPDDAYNQLKKQYMTDFEKSFPLKKVSFKNKPNKSWFDREAQELLDNKENLFKHYMKTKTNHSKTLFTQARNYYYRIIKEKKQTYYKSKFNIFKGDIKNTWRLINNLLGKQRKSDCKKLKIDGKEIYEPQALANHFNNHFSTIASKLMDELPPSEAKYSEYLKPSSRSTMFVWPTCPMEISNILHSMKSKLSAGIDQIPSKLLKSSPDNILVALSHIFNLSLSKGEFINDFKLAKVCPIYKKGDSSNINNYRPISLLSNVSKILEKIMYRRLCTFLDQSNFFSVHQFGFRKHHNTSHAITFMVHKITESLSHKVPTLGIFLDLSKAFDTIDHDILLHKLQHYGVRGIAYDWFKSYLTGRTQQVECNGTLSNIINPVTRGVPQGSNLGPLLFLVYVNDFQNCLKFSDPVMFADDTSIFLENKNIATLYERAQEELHYIDKWMVANNLSINVSKTKCILFRSSKSKPPPTNLTVTLRNIKIEQVTTMKFLGVHIDEHLTWTGHIRHLQNKLRSTLGVVSRIKPFLRQGSMLTLYHSLINSHLQYCITNWCIGNKTLINKLQKTCNKFIRMACNLRHYRDVTDVRKTHQLLTINQLLTKEIAVFMFKQNSGKNPDVFRNVFVKSISQYNTRNRSKLIPKPCSSSLCQQSISYQGPAIWSKLPIFFKNEKMSVVTFSAKLRNYLCTNSIGI